MELQKPIFLKSKKKHPKVEIITSKNYQNKVAAIAENLQSGKEIDGFTIPTNLWYRTAKMRRITL